MTHTFVVLEISTAAYAEIRNKLLAAGYEHAVLDQDDGEVIDMHGIAVRAEAAESLVPGPGGEYWVCDPCRALAGPIKSMGFFSRRPATCAACHTGLSPTNGEAIPGPSYDRVIKAQIERAEKSIVSVHFPGRDGR